MMLVGMGLLFAFGGTATADTPTGGCTGSANGRDAAGLTQDNPRRAKEHPEPSLLRVPPPPARATNQTHIKVFLVDGLGGITSEDHAGDGDTWSSNSVKIDDYLKYGVGTYKVEVTNTGADWVCTYVGYVQLDGNPLGKPIGWASIGLLAVGAVGAAVAPRRAASPAWQATRSRSVPCTRGGTEVDTILDHGDKILDAADGTPPTPAPQPDEPWKPTHGEFTTTQEFAAGQMLNIARDPLSLCSTKAASNAAAKSAQTLLGLPL